MMLSARVATWRKRTSNIGAASRAWTNVSRTVRELRKVKTSSSGKLWRELSASSTPSSVAEA